MLNGKKVRLRRIEKADLWHLWQWHENQELYLFKTIKPFITWNELQENFKNYFSWKRDFIIENKENEILGICSYNKIDWKNRSCTLSFKMHDDYRNLLFSVDTLQTVSSLIFNELNLYKIDFFISEISSFEIQALEKAGFIREGILREHIFQDGKYIDLFIFALFKEDFNKNA